MKYLFVFLTQIICWVNLPVTAQENLNNTKWKLIQLNDSNIINSPITIEFREKGRYDFHRESNHCDGTFLIKSDSISFTSLIGCTRTGTDKDFSLRIMEIIMPSSKYILSPNYLFFGSEKGRVVFEKVN